MRKTDRVPHDDRREPLAEVTLPVLEVCSDLVCLGYVAAGAADVHAQNAPAVAADLPVNFRALWLRTDHIYLGFNELSGGGIFTNDHDREAFSVAEELCRVLSLAPEGYQEYRLFVRATHPTLRICAEWWSPPDDKSDHYAAEYDDLPAVSDAMQPFADTDGLAFSLSEGATYLCVERVGPRHMGR